MKKNFIITLLFLIWTSCVYANIETDLNHYFKSLGMSSNTTAPRFYKGQQAGYYNGGSLFARSAVRNVQIAEVDLPSYRAGCGGIDLFAGGFSFVNSDQLVNVMRNVMNNAKGYALTLALEEVTPQIANAMKYMQDMANKVNQMNISSCETAEDLVGGLWPKTRAASQYVCQDAGTHTGMFSDWASARQGCASGNQFSNTMLRASTDENYKDRIFDKGNLAWKLLQKNGLTASDPNLAELFMSLSGTVILAERGTGDAATHPFKHLPSLAADPSLLKTILEGGTVSIYICDEHLACINPTLKPISIATNVALKSQVQKILQHIAQKIQTDTALTGEEIGLLQATRIPLYKILNVQAAYQKDANILDVDSYAEVIATDILFQYLHENLNFIKSSSDTSVYPESLIETFQKDLDVAMNEVREKERQAHVQISTAMQLIQQTQAIEQMLAGELSSELSSHLEWARSL